MTALLVSLIFIRPFISSLAFSYLNALYSYLLLGFLLLWNALNLHRGRRAGSNLPYREIIIFIAALLISSIFSTDKWISIGELYKYISGLLIFILAFSLDTKSERLIICSILLSGLAISILAIYQYLWGFQRVLGYVLGQNISNPFVLNYITQKRAFIPFVTPNILGGYLAMLIPLALIDKERKWYILPMSLALFFTKSIGAYLAIFIALILYFYLQKKITPKTIILFLGVLITIVLVFFIRMASQKYYTQPSFSTLMRLGYWRSALIMIWKYPLTGVGLGNFNLVVSRYAHNSYLQICAEMGVLGLVSFLWLVIGVLKSAFKDSMSPGLFASVGVFLIHNLIDFSFFLPEISLIWWLLLGILLKKAVRDNKGSEYN